MPQIVFTLPALTKSSRAKRYVEEGAAANGSCRGRGANPHPGESLRFKWWDQGWCHAELSLHPEPYRTVLEGWLAAGNE